MRYVPTEYLVGTLPGKRDRHLTRCQPGQRVETERRQIGERLVQMPHELVERYGLVGERELELVVLGSESGRDEPRIPSSLPSASSTKPTENVLTAPVVCLAINAATTDESRPPLSMTPSGTSLISRRRTASSSASSTASASSARPSLTPVWVRESPIRLLYDIAVSNDEPMARENLLDGRQGSRRAREEPERVRVDRLVVEAGLDESAPKHALEF